MRAIAPAIAIGEARHDPAGQRGIGKAGHVADFIGAELWVAGRQIQAAITGKAT